MNRNVCTGTWTEQTAEGGYYRSARNLGAIQLLIDPTGRRMSGKWAGFSKDSDINTGPWDLIFLDQAASKTTPYKYDRKPSDSPDGSMAMA
ncbi:hypothetical protein [Nocardiopsis rhodophaea]|uniref:hypothetical protein n=1 Tax=Nocardiopsis rhodophaea TaxID=280238 RepID=UPI0031D1BE72